MYTFYGSQSVESTHTQVSIADTGILDRLSRAILTYVFGFK